MTTTGKPAGGIRSALAKLELSDLLLFGGGALVAFGLALVYLPLGPIVAGGALAILGWQLDKTPAPRPRPRQLVTTLSTIPGETSSELFDDEEL